MTVASSRQLILPAEIRSREFDARILQGMLAVQRGWQVVLGSKTMISRHIWRFPRGVFLCQTLTGRRVTILDLVSRLGMPSVGWCEEGLIYQSSDIYLMRRVAPATLSKLSAVVAWGERSRADLSVVANPLGIEVHNLGNPRLDLLRSQLRGVHDEEVGRLRNRFGDFILVNTNFSNVNCAPEAKSRAMPAAPPGSNASADLIERFEAFREYRRELFEHFQAMVPKLAKRFSNQTIVIRPHPAEDPKVWQDIAALHPNVEVVREGSVVPWVLASRAMIHNGCTTAVETALMDRCPIAYCPVVRSELDAVLANDISRVADGIDELIGLVEAEIDGELALDEQQQQTLDRFVSSRQGPLASERILDLCDGIADAHKVETIRAPLRPRIGAMMRHAQKAIRVNHRNDRYLPTVFPATAAAYVERRCAAMASCLGETSSRRVAVRALGGNIFEMKAA
ncbi:MAG: surface carbohydrate biosynthesis protein [Pseudomonadota bacterium]